MAEALARVKKIRDGHRSHATQTVSHYETLNGPLYYLSTT